MWKLLSLLTLTSCGVTAVTDQEFSTYVTAWKDYTGRGQRVPINFYSNMESNESLITREHKQFAAVCRSVIVGGTWHNKRIVIKRKDWGGMDECQRAHIIFHELIHCELQVKEHDDTEYITRDGESVMGLMTTNLNLAAPCYIEDVYEQLSDKWREDK